MNIDIKYLFSTFLNASFKFFISYHSWWLENLDITAKKTEIKAKSKQGNYYFLTKITKWHVGMVANICNSWEIKFGGTQVQVQLVQHRKYQFIHMRACLLYSLTRWFKKKKKLCQTTWLRFVLGIRRSVLNLI